MSWTFPGLICLRWRRRALLLALLLAATAGAADAPLKCLDCHEKLTAKSVHDGAADCKDCHVDVLKDEHATKGAKPVDCGLCHEDQAKVFAQDIHTRLGARPNDKPFTCASCHNKHQALPAGQLKKPEEQVCAACHQNLIVTGKYHQQKFLPDSTCTECHDSGQQRHELQGSVHSKLSCVDCHQDAAAKLEKHADKPGTIPRANCGTCHRGPAVQHRESIHGISLREGIKEAAQCWSCHGGHNVVPTAAADSPVSPAHLAATCDRCHGDPKFVKRFALALKDVGTKYELSVHGQKVGAGQKAATCVTCHGVHDIKNRTQPGSRISSFGVPATCGQCHAQIAAEYQQSIHWTLARRGGADAPVCNDCHSEHEIEAVNGSAKKAEMRKLQDQACVRCHQDPIVAHRYGLDADKAGQYLDSYHGLAVARGSLTAAMCVDCHGVHAILPRDDPAASISAANVQATCQKCHPGASRVFAASYAHNPIVDKARIAEFWVRRIYWWLIIATIGGMVVHNLIIMGYEFSIHRRQKTRTVTLTRFTTNEVVQHFLLMVSFTVLAASGFALKFPDFVLFRLIESWGLTEPLRQQVHRVSGVALALLGVYHLIYLGTTRSGRALLTGLLPRWRDLRGFLYNVLYHLKLRPHEPEFDQFDYVEKSEYWALIWGTVIMAVTGAVLWFPTLVGDWAPVWLIRVCEIVHYYEAILATLAIIVWHLFFVVYHPRQYPMNYAWLDGRITLADFKHHYRGQFKAIVAEWQAAQDGRLSPEKFTYRTRQFVSFLRQSGLDPDAVLRNELAEDAELRAWLEEQRTVPPEREPAPPVA